MQPRRHRSRWGLISVVSVLLFTVPLSVVGACGDTEAEAPAVDSGVEAEAAPPPEVDSATCDLSENLLDRIPDASLADGESTTGVCLGCVNALCTDSVMACNALCDCKGAVATGLDCYLKHADDPSSCVLVLAGVDNNVRTLGLKLIGCVQANCKEQCATSAIKDGG